MTKKPSYRFAGYTESWEEKKLGEVSTHRSGTSIEKYFAENGVYKVISIGSYGLDGEYIDQGIRAISNEVTDKKIVKENELTMVLNDKTSNGTIIGRTLFIKSSNEFVVNQRTEIISPKEILDSQYAYVLLNSNFREQVKKIVQGGTQIYVNYSSVEQLKLPLPSLPEQTAIGSFFQDIDQLISLQQRKLEVLKEQKKTYLKLLFPAKGQTKPTLRFAGFEDEWKEVKLGEILVERNEQISESEEYQLMSFVQGKGVVPKSDRYDRSFLVKDDKKNYKKTEYGDFIYSSNNLDTGSIGFNKTGKALISPVYSIFYSKTKKESQFIAILSQRKEFINEMIKYRQGVVYGQFRIHESDFLNIKILAPESNEQESLITFFQDLDKAIAKQEEKVNQLKESKQTLLRKMFI